MESRELEELLEEVDPSNPCGEDVSYDPAFLQLETIFQTSDGDILGQEQVRPEPKWGDVIDQCKSLYRRSKHLRVAVYLSLALLKQEGFVGFRDGLSLIRHTLEKFWDSMYPQLDPDDDDDPIERINIFTPFSDRVRPHEPLAFRHRLSEVPLFRSAQLGSFAYRDLQIAKGTLKVSEDKQGTLVPLSVIEAAMKDTPAESLQVILEAITHSLEHLHAIRGTFMEHSKSQQYPNLESCESLLREILGLLKPAPAESAAAPADGGDEVISPAGVPAIRSTAGAGEISSSQDAIAEIDRLCRYFEKYEPSSPVPLILQRAKKLISKTFFEIIEDMCPDSLGEIERISGSRKQDE